MESNIRRAGKVDLLTPSNALPGSEEAREFVGSDHGADLTLILVNAPPGHGPNLHRHPYEEIFAVHGGRGTFFVDGLQVEAGPETSCSRPLGAPTGSSVPGPIACG